MTKEVLAESGLGRRALSGEMSSLDGTLRVERRDGFLLVTVHKSMLPPLRPASAAMLRTLIDDQLEAEAAES